MRFLGTILFAGLTADLDHVLVKLRTVVPGLSGSVEYPTHEVVGVADTHRDTEESDGIVGPDSLGSCEDLEAYKVTVQLDDVGIAVSDHGQIVVSDTFGTYRDDVSDYGFNLSIDLVHLSPP